MGIVYFEVSAHLLRFEIIHDNLQLLSKVMEDYRVFMEEKRSAWR
jgi:hypothetical protein